LMVAIGITLSGKGTGNGCPALAHIVMHPHRTDKAVQWSR
jgi:hypothetical protein